MTKPVREQLAQMAAKALALADGDLAVARKQMKRKLQADTELLSAVLDAVVADAVELCVGVVHRDTNRAAFATVTREERQQRQKGAVQAAMQVLLLDVVLGVSGVRLRSAHRPELRSEAAFHWKQSRTMGIKAAFFTAVANRLPNDKVAVEKVLTEEELRTLFSEARSDASAA